MEKIKIKYYSNTKKLSIKENSDWIDLYVAEDVFIPLNTFKLISLGVAIELPEGYEAIIAPRSSTFKNYGIIQTNHIGIIDNSYNGENDIWKFPAFCLTSKTEVNGIKGTEIHKNDRICQFRIMKNQPQICFEEVSHLDGKDRGGFGSTGK